MRQRIQLAVVVTLMTVGIRPAGLIDDCANRSFAEDVQASAGSSSLTGQPNRILVLKDGRVMRGQIRTVSTGFLVASPTGYSVLPFEQVLFDADSVEDAWYRMRLQDKKPTVTSHLKIARWCFSHRFTQGTLRELREALELDPSNETVRLMLKRVDDELRRQERVAEENQRGPRAFVAAVEVRQSDEARSLSGLNPETARRFVSRIQPLLLNRCGNARCHGVTASEREFRLEHIRSSGNQRRRIERNLGAVLKRIDVSQPRQSALLQAGQGVHAGQLIFVGRAGALQLETFRQWVFRVAAELPPGDGPVAGAGQRITKTASDTDWGDLLPGGRQLTQLPTRPAAEKSRFDLSQTSSSAATTQKSERVRTAEDGLPPGSAVGLPDATKRVPDSQLSHVQALLRETDTVDDAFDPEKFNRQYTR